jgi:hypothetical protein
MSQGSMGFAALNPSYRATSAVRHWSTSGSAKARPGSPSSSAGTDALCDGAAPIWSGPPFTRFIPRPLKPHGSSSS